MMTDDEEERVLGHINLSSGSAGVGANEVEIVDTTDEDSEDDVLSDTDARLVTSPRSTTPPSNSNSRRQRRSSTGDRQTEAPSRQTNLSSSSFSTRFRRYSAAQAVIPASITTAPTDGDNNQITSTSPSTTMWKSRDTVNSVDQSINLMNLPYGDGTTTTTTTTTTTPTMARARPNMTARQRSLVDIFLSDGNSSHHQQRKSTNTLSTTRSRSRYGVPDPLEVRKHDSSLTFRTTLCWMMVVVGAIVLIWTTPNFGLLARLGDLKEGTPEPTTAPVEEEEPMPATTGDVESRLAALEFYMLDHRLTDPRQLQMEGTPSNKALQWIVKDDPAQMDIPGLDSGNVAAKQEIVQRYALAVLYFSVQEGEEDEDAASTSSSSGNAGRMRVRKLQGLTDEERSANREKFDATWMTGESVCQWHGVLCDNDQSSVVKLRLARHMLKGTLPRELFVSQGMPFLKEVDFTSNQLQGSFPPVAQQGNLGPVVEILKLSHNELTGSLENVMPLTSLQEVNLDSNKFTGAIPKEIMNMSQLEYLMLMGNELSGAVPWESLFKLASLKSLKLANNNFSGELPEDMAPLSKLQDLFLNLNQFEGGIPNSLGELTLLRRLLLNDNKMGGEVPTQFGQLTSLMELQLGSNELTGEMPQEVCDLRDDPLSKLVADCESKQITCDCCSLCL